MSYYTVTVRTIYVVGRLWGGGRAAYSYALTPTDVENIGELTRENCQLWLDKNAGDFESIIDFAVDIADFESDWATEEGRNFYNDCTREYYEDED